MVLPHNDGSPLLCATVTLWGLALLSCSVLLNHTRADGSWNASGSL